jgi:hypothetical protein
VDSGIKGTLDFLNLFGKCFRTYLKVHLYYNYRTDFVYRQPASRPILMSKTAPTVAPYGMVGAGFRGCVATLLPGRCNTTGCSCRSLICLPIVCQGPAHAIATQPLQPAFKARPAVARHEKISGQRRRAANSFSRAAMIALWRASISSVFRVACFERKTREKAMLFFPSPIPLPR